MRVRLAPALAVFALLVAAAPVCAASVGAEKEGAVFIRGGRTIPRDKVVVVGHVSISASKHQPKLEAFADWLAPRLRREGIVAGAGIVARSAREMVALLRRKQVDIVSESVLTAVMYEQRAGAEIIMNEWKDGQPYYQTVFIAPRRSLIFGLRDLVGKRLAFQDGGSTTGFLLPVATLIQAGLRPVELTGPKAVVPAGAVGYVFARSESNISAWTASGLVDAGAYSNLDWERKKSNPKRFRHKLRIFYVTRPLMHAVVLVRPGMAPALKKAIIAALEGFETDSSAVGVHETYYDVTRFTPIVGKAERDLAQARAIYGIVRRHLE